jgi:hypothetical protein
MSRDQCRIQVLTAVVADSEHLSNECCIDLNETSVGANSRAGPLRNGPKKRIVCEVKKKFGEADKD